MTNEEKTLLNKKIKEIKKGFKTDWNAKVETRTYGDGKRGLLYVLLFDDDILEYVVEAPYSIEEDEESVKTSTLQVHAINGFITSRYIAKIEKVLGK